ncbi:hypothetical protein TSAR_006330 [Trichomalopsis sarcophagae]|uniref:Uncharacterized protein n=1 Tax=Trichomalopsis sarcophagae TaxID=543379 RepID=A0A232EJ95_9HYME|nr:hypothetical protein TSAR_006330 [Trichomalopsis sarcophagae]
MTTVSGFLANEEPECGASNTSSENSEPLGIPVSVFEAFDDFAYVPRQAEREQVTESTTPDTSVSYLRRFRSNKTMDYWHITTNQTHDYIHLHSVGRHFTPYIRTESDTLPDLENSEPKESYNETAEIPEHSFRYKENIFFLLTTDIFLETEILDATLERGYTTENILRSTERNLGDVFITDFNGMKLFGLFIESHINEKQLKA